MLKAHLLKLLIPGGWVSVQVKVEVLKICSDGIQHPRLQGSVAFPSGFPILGEHVEYQLLHYKRLKVAVAKVGACFSWFVGGLVWILGMSFLVLGDVWLLQLLWEIVHVGEVGVSDGYEVPHSEV